MHDNGMEGLKDRTIRGGFAKVCAQAANFSIRIGSLMILGRLLEPRDFGLVGMAVAIIGVLNLFKDFGLSTATIQRASVTAEQLSTLFWINILIGAVLAVACVAAAPLLAAFYHEPRLIALTAVLGAGFLFNAAGVQHAAVLQRQMRFTAMAVIEVVSQLISSGLGIGMALSGYGPWSIVATTVTLPAASSICAWLAAPWLPGMPRRAADIWSMIWFGGGITVNSAIVYIAFNVDKVLIGRFWGAAAVGIYGRAYQLINIPTDNLNYSIGGVAFSALSRLQNDPVRLRSYFLKGYAIVLGLTAPITTVCALFADDLIAVVLGPKWSGVVPIFRLLFPTILAFALLNPLSWLLFSLGLVRRSLTMAVVFAPLVIASYCIGLPYGPKGVALSCSVIMSLSVCFQIPWCLHGTGISVRNILVVVGRPLLSSFIAAVLVFGLHFLYAPSLPPLPRLVLGTAAVLSIYAGMLIYVMGQKAVYLNVVRDLRRGSLPQETECVTE